MTIDWDAWRAEHAEMSFHDQQLFYQRVAREHPEQQHFDLAEAAATFDLINTPGATVVELGGWNGALASRLLSKFPISSWTNYDIVGVPQVCDHPRYQLVVLDDYFWKLPARPADAFVATHTIEHLTGEELEMLLDALLVDFIYLESPLGSEGQSWAGYPGSHILELGWREVRQLISDMGYVTVRLGADTGLWQVA